VANLPTITMTPMPEFGYEPLEAIKSGNKTHTLRMHWLKAGLYEVVCNKKRTGVVIKVKRSYGLLMNEYLTDEFAQNDGFPDSKSLQEALWRFYRQVPPVMWCVYFDFVSTGDA